MLEKPMEFRHWLNQLLQHQDLSAEQARAWMTATMQGELTSLQIASLLVALRSKGESVIEIAEAAKVMRSFATPVIPESKHLVDTCGTGGDSAGLFNVSTCVAFVAAAAGAKVAKHGNRSVSSLTGSADVLEALGVEIQLTPEQMARCIDSLGVGFLFAPLLHPAMKYAVEPRRELGVRTLFNVLGPLTNPAGAQRQVIGVFDPAWLRPMAEVLRILGSTHALIVHGNGLDEFTLFGTSQVAELKNGEIEEYDCEPEDFGISSHNLDSLRVTSAEESAQLIQKILKGKPGPAADLVALNAGAAIYVAGCARTMQQGVDMAQDALSTGLASERLKELVELTRLFKATN
ncbi:MAG: anthranilate phosphoribosyltransferase [Pseudomonadota bacterium]